ncbi:MAG: MFS transporter [Chloroflexi bacterium]|nr:MFS transporter [Chloroflexota bacterium]
MAARQAAPDPAAPTWGLFGLFLARLTLNTSFRIIYPFLPSIARGLGITLAQASALVTLRMTSALFAPLLGAFADRFGRRRTMALALGLFTLAALSLAGLRTLPAAVVAFALFGLAKMLYDPAVHAYLGDAVPYHQRGRAIGALELSWSAAWLVGVPASGVLIERFGWQAPWAVLIILGVGSLGLTLASLPVDHQEVGRGSQRQILAETLAVWRVLLRRRDVQALLATSFCLVLAMETPFIVYGGWLETAFGLSLSTLGLASAVVGLAEAAAELGSASFTDRLGKRRSALLGLLGLAVSLLALPWLAGLGLTGALVGVACIVVTFEFAIVSILPLATELAPTSRASLMALNMTAIAAARVVGALLGAWLWGWGSIVPHAVVGALCAVLGAAAARGGLREIGQPVAAKRLPHGR